MENLHSKATSFPIVFGGFMPLALTDMQELDQLLPPPTATATQRVRDEHELA